MIAVLTLDIVGGATGFKFDFARHDAFEDGADVQTEVAADALVANDGFARFGIHGDGLVTAVVAADHATAAADAFARIVQQLLQGLMGLGIVAPPAAQRAALQEHHGAYGRPVMNGKTFRFQ